MIDINDQLIQEIGSCSCGIIMESNKFFGAIDVDKLLAEKILTANHVKPKNLPRQSHILEYVMASIKSVKKNVELNNEKLRNLNYHYSSVFAKVCAYCHRYSDYIMLNNKDRLTRQEYGEVIASYVLECFNLEQTLISFFENFIKESNAEKLIIPISDIPDYKEDLALIMKIPNVYLLNMV
jgi:hypothetical protein